MDNLSVHMGATLTNPDSLNEAELREALTAANQQLFQRDLKIVELQQQSLRLGSCIATICDQVLATDWANLGTTLSRLAANYQQQKAALAARKFH